jgi:DNA-binding CsgD family transcriptional regulator
LTTVNLKVTRETGALIVLPHALTYRAIVDLHHGDDEACVITAAMDTPPLTHASLLIAGWRGDEGRALELVGQTHQDASYRGEGFALAVAGLSAAVLYNGLGRYDQALAAAKEAAELSELGLGGWSLVELIEAAARAGQPDVAAVALHRLSQLTRHSGTNWALGMEARSRALLSEGHVAEDLYLEAIDRLERSGIKAHLARARLVYGEWLRRQGRRSDARVPLRAARESLASMGAEGFADRAHHEILATGETVRRRALDTRDELTPQERRVASLARSGLTNPEIGARLFLSPRTVEYHLTKIFAKLDITSRTALGLVLPHAFDETPWASPRIVEISPEGSDGDGTAIF